MGEWMYVRRTIKGLCLENVKLNFGIMPEGLFVGLWNV